MSKPGTQRLAGNRPQKDDRARRTKLAGLFPLSFQRLKPLPLILENTQASVEVCSMRNFALVYCFNSRTKSLNYTR